MMQRVSVLALMLSVMLLAAWFGTRYWIEQRVVNAIEFQLALLPAAVEVRYGQVRVDLPSLRTHIHDIVVRLGDGEPPVRVQRLTVHGVDRDNRLPRHLDMELVGLRQNLAQSAQPYARFLHGYGFEETHGDLALRYHFDIEQQRLHLDRLLVDLAPLGRLDVTARLRIASVSGVLYRDWRPEEAVALEQLIASWEDIELVRRMMLFAATGMGMTPTTLAANIAAELDHSAAAFETPRLDATVETLWQFLPDPGAVTLYLEPEQPLALTGLRDTALVNPPKAALDTRLLIEPGRWR
ncbi:MAG: hypothetical protein WED00_12170 [Aquisalimonadaceae bacterium]